MPQEIQLFAGRQIRSYWDDNEEKYYFCIIDSIEALTDSKDPAGYFKKLRQRDPELDAFVRGTNCPPTSLSPPMANDTTPNTLTYKDFSVSSSPSHPRKPNPSCVGSHRWEQTASTRCKIQNSAYSSHWPTSNASAIPTIGSTSASSPSRYAKAK